MRKFWDAEADSRCVQTRRLADTVRTEKMALRRGRATSRRAGETRECQGEMAPATVWFCLCLLLPSAAEAGLYSTSDQVISLSPGNVESVLVNSSAAIIAEFYASWCGYCITFSPIYKRLARDIKGRYGPAASHVDFQCLHKLV